MDASYQPARGNLGRRLRTGALVPPTMEDRDVLQGSQVRISSGSMPARNSRSVNTLSHRHEHRGMEVVHDYIDRPHEPILALFAIPLGAGVDGAIDQIFKESKTTSGLTHHSRSTCVDRQTGSIFGKKERWAARNTRTMARVEKVGGFN